ncbi:DUF221-domain-containing protein, partial [Cadophora sp. DSE1049]
ATLVLLLIISVPLLLTFLFLRVKLRRVYAPRTFIKTLRDEEKTPKLEKTGFVDWMPEFWRRPDDELLDHQNLDGYLFIRFLWLITSISFVGLCCTLPVLIINYMGGGKKSELASLTVSNVAKPKWYYWHCLIASIFFGYVMYAITKETIYYINLRYAFYLTPRNAMRISSRTVLFTSVPPDWRRKDWLRAEFDQLERVWIVADCKELGKLVRKRDNAAFNLEAADIKLLSTAVTKSTKEDVHSPYRGDDITSRYIGSHDRPKMRFIPLIGQINDAINSLRYELQELIPKVKQQQEDHLYGRAETLPAVLVQFKTQRAAQAAFQTHRQDQPGNMQPRAISQFPNDIIWKNLGMARWIRIALTSISHAIMVILILFWSVPVGLVGALTNVDALVADFPFLSFINKISVVALDTITGLLPALLISALLALVPAICRFLAAHSGTVTSAQIELRTQAWYFAFQVVQVFLITTFSSGASTVANQIFEDPTKAPSLLADNLPKASNFYLSYFMFQGITVAATEIFQVTPLLIFAVVGKFIDKTPRAKYNRWTALNSISLRETYPKLTNLVVIALAYSCIAPLTLSFATAGFSLLYLAYRYNVFYAVSIAVETKGDTYGRALQQLTVGIYLAELCLVGLFNARGGRGPAQLMVLFFVITVIYQFYLNWVLSPLLNSLSDKLLADEKKRRPSITSLIHDNLGTRDEAKQSRWSLHRERGGCFAHYLFHGIKSPYPELRAKISSAFPGQPVPNIPEDVKEKAYLNPAITAPVPILWIARDGLGVSSEQIKQLRPVIEIVDSGASFDREGNVTWNQENLRDLPLWQDRVDL